MTFTERSDTLSKGVSVTMKRDDNIKYVYKKCLNSTCHHYKRQAIHKVDIPPSGEVKDAKAICLSCDSNPQHKHMRTIKPFDIY